MIEIKRFGFDNKQLLKISNSIRTKVFVEEQHVDPELEYENEEDCHFYLLYYKKKPIATARWRETSEGIKLERFAMLKEYRNKGLGAKLLDEVMKDVISLNMKIYLHSQVSAVNYYKRAGFIEEGKRFWEANIEHVKMIYNLSSRRKPVCGDLKG
jgi:predicted GNAT family N-acyltransferase